jgi:predicted Fe-Mo cluster-binding NifX family protein
MDTKNIKVAIVTDDGTTISQHFGRARYYEVLTVANGAVTNRERRDKAGHHTFAGGDHQHEPHGAGHGQDAHSQAKHMTMTSNVLDCQILVARGMGFGAYQHITEAKLTPIITNTPNIDDAVREIIEGTMVNHEERLH